ncbi:related to para-nitrobenzyl esterase [Ustilago trichophora]|uniref:Carboxylic ester hydrolase n=1 Tax=Ustilago trichophora TaxID=86804 RepID=A0A5C3EIP9_9BASI|nr:related to para-nitrobenzyl esterase [Ustilago trichophora]
MILLGPFLCLVCSFITGLYSCEAAPATAPRSNPLLVSLPLGSVLGANTAYSAQRFTLPYTAPPVGQLRFASPQPITTFSNGSKAGTYDASQLPKACIQQPDSRYGIQQDGISEDCLYLNIFRPTPGNQKSANLPVLFWVHGGSFISGSSTAPGLDGSYLASQNNIIVITVQYRLGIFGWFSPSQFTDESTPSSGKVQGNQGLLDVILALRFVQDHIAAFGGDPGSITLAGQSSGAHLIRALLNSPTATSLFHRAILHSDPSNFGTQTKKTSGEISDYALSQTGCSDLACLRGMDVGDVLRASSATVAAGQGIDGSVAAAEVWRPFVGEITGSAFEGDPAGSSLGGKPVVWTNVENEAGSVVGSMLMPTATGATSAQLRAYPVTLTREQLLEQMFNANRASTLAACPQYGMNSNTSSYPTPAKVQVYSAASDSLRRNLETLLTQGMFTCPTWFNALRYAPKAPVYVALFEKGISYPSNQGNDYCTQGRVCHEDDILLIFSDPDKVDGDSVRVLREVQARWVSFMRSGNPNGGGYGGWDRVGASQQAAKVLRLGVYAGQKGSMLDTISLQTGQYAGCGQVWGSKVQFDWQLYG